MFIVGESEFSHLRKRGAENCIFAVSLECAGFQRTQTSCREHGQVAETFRQRTFCCDLGLGVCSGGPQEAEESLPVAHISWCTSVAFPKVGGLFCVFCAGAGIGLFHFRQALGHLPAALSISSSGIEIFLTRKSASTSIK